MPEPLYRVDTHLLEIYLTFDDGPYVQQDVTDGRAGVTTDAVLDQLEALRVTVSDPLLSATFFLNGWGFVREEPDSEDDPDHALPTARRTVAERILAAGHDIANHSFRHLQPWGKPNTTGGPTTLAAMVAEIERAQEAFDLLAPPASASGRIVPYFRAPGDPSYFTGVSPAEPIAGSGPPVGTADRDRLSAIVDAADATDHRYMSFNIWSKDEALSQTPGFVFWHSINVSHWNLALRPPSQPKDKALLSYEDLDEHPRFHTRRGAILLMHNGRSGTLKALGPPIRARRGAVPGIVPYLYDQTFGGDHFRIRRLPRGLLA